MGLSLEEKVCEREMDDIAPWVAAHCRAGTLSTALDTLRGECGARLLVLQIIMGDHLVRSFVDEALSSDVSPRKPRLVIDNQPKPAA